MMNTNETTTDVQSVNDAVEQAKAALAEAQRKADEAVAAAREAKQKAEAEARQAEYKRQQELEAREMSSVFLTIAREHAPAFAAICETYGVELAMSRSGCPRFVFGEYDNESHSHAFPPALEIARECTNSRRRWGSGGTVEYVLRLDLGVRGETTRRYKIKFDDAKGLTFNVAKIKEQVTQTLAARNAKRDRASAAVREANDIAAMISAQVHAEVKVVENVYHHGSGASSYTQVVYSWEYMTQRTAATMPTKVQLTRVTRVGGEKAEGLVFSVTSTLPIAELPR